MQKLPQGRMWILDLNGGDCRDSSAALPAVNKVTAEAEAGYFLWVGVCQDAQSVKE